MKPFNRLIKRYRKWQFNQMKRNDIKNDMLLVKRLEKTLSKLPQTPTHGNYQIKIKAFKDLSKDALNTEDINQYLNIRRLQADIMVAFVNEVNSNQLDKTRQRPGVA